jgi:hypothetical protein
MKLSNKTYDVLNGIQVICVILAAFWDDIAEAWGLPYQLAIQKTLLAVAAALLAYLKASSMQYYKAQNEDTAEVRPDELNADIVSHEDIDGVG